jgi:hypothetical protein
MHPGSKSTGTLQAERPCTQYTEYIQLTPAVLRSHSAQYNSTRHTAAHRLGDQRTHHTAATHTTSSRAGCAYPGCANQSNAAERSQNCKRSSSWLCCQERPSRTSTQSPHMSPPTLHHARLISRCSIHPCQSQPATYKVRSSGR